MSGKTEQEKYYERLNREAAQEQARNEKAEREQEKATEESERKKDQMNDGGR